MSWMGVSLDKWWRVHLGDTGKQGRTSHQRFWWRLRQPCASQKQISLWVNLDKRLYSQWTLRKLVCMISETTWWNPIKFLTRVGTLIVATIYLQLIQNRYMFRSFTTRCQRCGSCRIPLAAPVVLIVRMERSTAWRISGTVLKRMPRSHKGLSPCDFDLIPKMKEPLRGIRFRTVPEILQAVDRSIRTINTTGAAKGILRLPHRWQRVVNSAGGYIEGQ